MEGYRLFLMFDGHIRAAKEFEATSDREAIARAEDLRAGQPAELWSGPRVVRRFDARQNV